MNQQLCLLFLVSLAVLLVKSEFTIEVDENGDEYEVKRFNIPSRHLNEARSQCVEIRRKRAAQLQPQFLYSDNESNDELEDKQNDDSDAIKEDQEPGVMFYSPPVISSAAAEEGDAEQEVADDTLSDMNKEKPEEMILSDVNVKNNNTISEKNKEDGDDQNKDDTEIIEVVQLPQLPILVQLQNDGDSVANMASHEADTKTEGIVVVHSHKPPKVNPQTHALFELIPVENVISEPDYEEDNYYDNIDNGEADLYYSTTDAWSTGDDNPNDIYDDDDQIPLRVRKVKKTKQRKNDNKKSSAQKPKRKTQPGSTSGNTNRYENSNENKHPLNKTQKKPAGTKTRPANTSNNKPALSTVPNKLKATKKPFSNNGNHFYSHNNRKRPIDTRNKNRKQSHTSTWSGTEDYNGYGNKDFNCIVIRKEPPPTTTQRPFWKFWGRSANGARQTTDHFGKRKRANLRFVA